MNANLLKCRVTESSVKKLVYQSAWTLKPHWAVWEYKTWVVVYCNTMSAVQPVWKDRTNDSMSKPLLIPRQALTTSSTWLLAVCTVCREEGMGNLVTCTMSDAPTVPGVLNELPCACIRAGFVASPRFYLTSHMARPWWPSHSAFAYFKK